MIYNILLTIREQVARLLRRPAFQVVRISDRRPTDSHIDGGSGSGH